MASAKRVLFLGLTGIAKRKALENLARYCKSKFYQDCEVVDLDNDFLVSRIAAQPAFLDDDIWSQRKAWCEAWDLCRNEQLEPLIEADKHIFLGLHGCYLRTHYGSRCVLDMKRIAQFKPTLIITLIADVYDMWWRTEERARGEAWRGQPSPEHLIEGRRAEVMVADQIALECSSRPRSLVLAIQHPCDTVSKCIFSPKPRVVYLSFPISEPRRMADKGDMSGIEEVSGLIRHVYERQKSDADLACVCPLAIDELPFSKCFKGICDAEAAFDRDAVRWDLSNFWPLSERMGIPAEIGGKFRSEDVHAASGSIRTDVSWRDFRLAEQADKLAVFNPIFPGRETVTGGVANEVTFATKFGHPIYVYQDPKLDPNDLCAKWLAGFGSGTMGQGPSRQLISRKNSIDELIDAL
jgi:hypothetical protein